MLARNRFSRWFLSLGLSGLLLPGCFVPRYSYPRTPLEAAEIRLSTAASACLLRGHASFVDVNASEIGARIHLYGVDDLPRSFGLVGRLTEIKIYGKAGDVAIADFADEDLLTTVNPSDCIHSKWTGNKLETGDATSGIRTWEVRPHELGTIRLAKSGPPFYTVLARFKYQRRTGVYRTAVRGLFTIEEPYLARQELQVPAHAAGDIITKLTAFGTFHGVQGQASFDVDELSWSGGNAGRVEFFSAPPGMDNLFVDGYRIYFHLGSTASPFNISGLVGSYDGSTSWRFGARITQGGTPYTSEGTFVDIVQGGVEPLP